jgi:hypothetical protein
MRPDRIRRTGFIRGHCGSVAIEAPSGRATGAQRQFPVVGPISREWNLFPFHSPCRASIPARGALDPDFINV